MATSREASLGDSARDANNPHALIKRDGTGSGYSKVHSHPFRRAGVAIVRRTRGDLRPARYCCHVGPDVSPRGRSPVPTTACRYDPGMMGPTIWRAYERRRECHQLARMGVGHQKSADPSHGPHTPLISPLAIICPFLFYSWWQIVSRGRGLLMASAHNFTGGNSSWVCRVGTLVRPYGL